MELAYGENQESINAGNMRKPLSYRRQQFDMSRNVGQPVP